MTPQEIQKMLDEAFSSGQAYGELLFASGA
jgi:hypothetical protein